MWILLGYLVLGLIMIYGSAFIHIVYAEMNGYECIKWWEEHQDIIRSQINNNRVSYVYGLIIWPIRLIQFINSMPELYDQYDRR